LEANHALGIAAVHFGRFATAHEYLDQALALHSLEQHRHHAFVYGFDPAVSCMGYDSAALSYLGYPDQALKMTEAALALDEEVDHPFTSAMCRAGLAIAYHLRGDWQVCKEWAEACSTISRQYQFPHWLAWASALHGVALAGLGEAGNGIAEIRQGLEIHAAMGARLSRPTELGYLAEACLMGGQVEEGLAAVDDGLADIATRGEAWWEAVLHRLKGELLLSLPAADRAGAEASLRRSIAVAQRQEAKYFELQATNSLARCLLDQKRGAEIYEPLRSLYGSFSEGFETMAHKQANELLNLIRDSMVV
jgi:predicted ATPase